MRRCFGAVCLLAMLPVLCAQSGTRKKTATKKVPAAKTHRAARSPAKGKTAAKGKAPARAGRVSSKRGKGRAHVVRVAATAESRKLTSAFTASAQLRPMAQQLISTRTPAAYRGVAAYAEAHSGEASSAAHIALGHTYALDHRYPEAVAAFRLAATRGDALADYADYLGAQAAIAGNRGGEAYPLLDHFAERHPGSIFLGSAPVLLADAYLQQGNGQAALAVLTPMVGTSAAGRTDVRFALAKAYQATGNVGQAAELFRGIYLKDPLSNDAAGAKTQLAAMNVPLTAADRKQHADAMFNTKHYVEAQDEYRALQKSEKLLTQADKDALEIYEAVCDLRLKKLGRGEVERLPVTGDDSAALKLYLQSELRRNDNDFNGHDALVAQMLEKYPHSRWLEEALYSGGNMYSLKHESVRAITDYSLLVKQFPTSTYAPSAHWRAAWLSYRLRRYPDAARMMDEQIRMYPAGTEIPGALYWRGRLYEDVEHDFGQALNYYAAVNDTYVNSYYAILARQRSAVLGKRTLPDPAPALAFVKHVDAPELTDELPENDPHLIKARLLANAALNEYIGPEIQASATAASWGALAQAEIYQSFGENTRAVQTMKHSGLPFFSLPVSDVPHVYWALLFPRPYWDQLSADAQKNGLDPFLVASLIRQESEFNPGAVSKANAYGLMQLLPSVGKSEAKKEGVKKFNTNLLLNPSINLQLGTRDLRQSLDRYNGQVEYALASYNAGDTPVHQWIAMGDYKDIPEWVESIPYSETREYVQAIMRNREMYRAVYGGK
ncbi:MAG TPA: transglycosylase SLT domain-containing protein [Acidobacteriaceae bacterium]|nr:transglycosylase SLT domain-containing protein [Acidobacteriaceae bacterium]